MQILYITMNFTVKIKKKHYFQEESSLLTATRLDNGRINKKTGFTLEIKHVALKEDNKIE